MDVDDLAEVEELAKARKCSRAEVIRSLLNTALRGDG
jgi:hypothetical protein